MFIVQELDCIVTNTIQNLHEQYLIDQKIPCIKRIIHSIYSMYFPSQDNSYHVSCQRCQPLKVR